MSSFISSSFHDLSMEISTAVTISAVVVFTTTVWLLASEKLDPREPPLAYSRIPLLGHMINLLWYQNTYFNILHKTHPSPITTLLIFKQRLYVISSPNVAQLAFRATKTLDFEFIKTHATCRAVAFDKNVRDIINMPLMPDPDNPSKMSSYGNDTHNEMYGALAHGTALLQTNKRVLNCLAQSLNQIGGSWEQKKMVKWLKTGYTTASCEALYGFENPIKWDLSLIPRIWDFEADLGLLLLGAYPSFTARKGHKARSSFTSAFEKYFSAGHISNASEFIQGRVRIQRKWGLTTREISQAEILIVFASVTNTIPNALWLLCYIFSDLELLQELRQEVSGIVRKGEGVDMLLDIGGLREKCPLLTACFQESMRLVKTGFAVRIVLEDTILADRYLLKKGAVVQIPTGVMQADTTTWGEDAEVFNPYRWLPDETPSQTKLHSEIQGSSKDIFKTKDARKAQSAAYIPFGGGKNLCPGRHLAYTEIAGFAALVLSGFEIEEPGGGVLKLPESAVNRLGDGTRPPKTDVPFRIRRREGFENVRWGFVAGRGDESGGRVVMG